MDVEPLTGGPATAGRRVLLEGPAGSGKSTAAFARAKARLEAGARSEGLLYILPTDTLAEEARDRLARGLAPGVRDLWVTSLPGFCKKLLRQYDAFVPDLGPNPQILDGLEERLVVSQVLGSVDLEFYDKARGLSGFADDLVDFIDAVKLAGVALPEDTPRWRDLGRVLRAYDSFLREKNLLDLRDLTRKALGLLREHPEVVKEVRARAAVVDGWQDFNAAEGELLATLLGGMEDVLVAGDVSEAVLGFRGADAAGVRARLVEALRPEIVSLPARPRPTPETLRFEGAVDEAFGIARWLDRVTRVEGRAAFRDCAVLVRQAHAPEVRFLEEALADLGLPFVQMGTRHGLRGAMMAQLAAVLEVVAAPAEGLPVGAQESSLIRALSAPAFGLSPADMQAVAAGTDPSAAGRKVMRKFRAAVREAARGFDSEPLDVALYRTLLRFGFLGAAAETANADPLGGLLDLAEKFRCLSGPASRPGGGPSGRAALAGFLDYLEVGAPPALPGAADLWRADAVRLLTAHEVRGRSFRFVAVAGVAEDRFPKLFDERGLLNRTERRALGIRQGADPREHLLEEKRLFALACASGRDACRVSSARVYESGSDHAPSPLLAGLPAAAPEAGIRISRPEEVARPADAVQIFLATGDPAWEPLLTGRYDLDMLRGLREEYRQRLLWDKAPLPSAHMFSASQLETFHDCPAKSFYRDRLRLESADSFNRTVGNLVHAILEKFHGRFTSRAALRRAGDEPSRTFEALVEEMIRPADVGSRYAASLARALALRMLEAYLTEERSAPGEAEYALVEGGLEWKVQGENFRGRLDRLDRLPSGVHEIVDYKTGGGQGKMEKGLQTAIEKGESMQLPLYVHACRENNLPVITASIYWLRREGRKRAVLDLAKTADAFEAALRMAGERTAKMREGYYPSAPREGFSACRMCDFKDLCNDEDKIIS